ncbi:hypothetical protein IWZ03DRAFT_389101 [Phyllosticta citriasiana]|uniref:Transmembrane protein n=1 Tax=Phyllosticta citriasiana TaxID=595635 RepID=A0ABR1KB67_9PEZI
MYAYWPSRSNLDVMAHRSNASTSCGSSEHRLTALPHRKSSFIRYLEHLRSCRGRPLEGAADSRAQRWTQTQRLATRAAARGTKTPPTYRGQLCAAFKKPRFVLAGLTLFGSPSATFLLAVVALRARRLQASNETRAAKLSTVAFSKNRMFCQASATVF